MGPDDDSNSSWRLSAACYGPATFNPIVPFTFHSNSMSAIISPYFTHEAKPPAQGDEANKG